MTDQEEKIMDEIKGKFQDFLLNECKNNLEDFIRMKTKEILKSEVGNFMDFPMTVDLVARWYNVSSACIYKRCERGQIPFIRQGRTILIRFSDIAKIIIDADKNQ